MDAGQEDAVRAWVPTALTELEVADYALIDIDDLLSPHPELGAKVALSCLQLGVEMARSTLPEVGGILAIPLGYDDPPLDLTREIPDLSAVLAEPTNYAPGHSVPSLYLVQPWILNSPANGEKYVRSLASEEIPDGYVGRYEVGRSADEIEQGWELARTIYIQTLAVP